MLDRYVPQLSISVPLRHTGESEVSVRVTSFLSCFEMDTSTRVRSSKKRGAGMICVCGPVTCGQVNIALVPLTKVK